MNLPITRTTLLLLAAVMLSPPLLHTAGAARAGVMTLQVQQLLLTKLPPDCQPITIPSTDSTSSPQPLQQQQYDCEVTFRFCTTLPSAYHQQQSDAGCLILGQDFTLPVRFTRRVGLGGAAGGVGTVFAATEIGLQTLNFTAGAVPDEVGTPIYIMDRLGQSSCD